MNREITEEMVEAVARNMVIHSTGAKDPDKLVPAPRGQIGLIPLWQSYTHLAKAAIETIIKLAEKK